MTSNEAHPSSPYTLRFESSNSNMPARFTHPDTNTSGNGPTPTIVDPSQAVLEARYGITPDSVDPPSYQDDLLIEPMTAEQTTRYDRSPLPTKELLKHFQVPTALYTLTPLPTTPVPLGWIEFVCPEGQMYYYQPDRRIITGSNIKQPTILQALVRALEKLDIRLDQQNLILPPTTELTFEVDIDQRPPVVRYYFVDHAQKAEFWLEETNTEKLKCPPVTSYSHLKHLFGQHYWTHIEFYPMHLTLPDDVRDELVAVLTHACINHRASSLSMFPYNQEQCETFLRLIRNVHNSDRADGYCNRIFARLRSEIDGNHFLREDIPRLPPEPPLWSTALMDFLRGWLMLGSNKFYERTPIGMWANCKIRCARHWWVFMGSRVNKRKQQTYGYFLKSSRTFLPSITCAFPHLFTFYSSLLLSLPIITDTHYFDSVTTHTICFSGMLFVSVVIWLLAKYLRGRLEREELPDEGIRNGISMVTESPDGLLGH